MKKLLLVPIFILLLFSCSKGIEPITEQSTIEATTTGTPTVPTTTTTVSVITKPNYDSFDVYYIDNAHNSNILLCDDSNTELQLIDMLISQSYKEKNDDSHEISASHAKTVYVIYDFNDVKSYYCYYFDNEYINLKVVKRYSTNDYYCKINNAFNEQVANLLSNYNKTNMSAITKPAYDLYDSVYFANIFSSNMLFCNEKDIEQQTIDLFFSQYYTRIDSSLYQHFFNYNCKYFKVFFSLDSVITSYSFYFNDEYILLGIYTDDSSQYFYCSPSDDFINKSNEFLSHYKLSSLQAAPTN